MTIRNLNKSILLLYMYLYVLRAEHCPNKCVCKRTAQRDGPEWVKIRCGDTEKLSYVEDDDFLNIANEVVQLNLSNNRITFFSPKVQFVALQKLDISKNELTTIQNNQFSEIPNLRRLDLSENSIKNIDIAAFTNLKHLERLKLNHNQIITIVIGTFIPLTSLKQLDVTSNPLKCDCELLWLLDWADKLSVKLMSNPKCETPATFSGKPLRKLKVGEEYHCKSPAKNRDMPIVKLSPNHSQVVFEGDSIKLQCRVPSMTDSFDIFESETKDRVEWSWLDTNPRFHFEDVNIENRYLADTGFIDSSLSINYVTRNHSGRWNCQLISQQGNHSKGITVIVISDDTIYCPITITNNNKGSYTWPRSLANYTVTMPCESVQLTSDISEQKTSFHCSLQGQWKHLNTSKCPYISETTKILEQFSKVNLTLAKGSILESAKHFKNYTSDLKVMKDVMDLVFVARTLENYLHYLNEEAELGALLMDISNNLIDLDTTYLLHGELEDAACTKILKTIETIAFGLQFTPTSLLQKSNIAVEDFVVKKESFNGLTCTWYINVLDNTDRLFHCVTYNPSASSATQDRQIEASIQIPASLFEQLEEQDLITYPTPSLLIAMFSNSKLFPIKYESGQEEVTSAVVGVKLRKIVVTNLTDPIYVMLKPLQQYTYDPLMPPTPVWWNPSLNSGNGGWSSEGCQLSHELKDNLVFSCKQLSYYGLLQDTSHASHVQTGAKFKFSHPAIYVGSIILFVCLLFTILTYLLCYPAIQMPKKTKHSLMNTWITLSLLCFMYVIGIYQTEDLNICRGVGLTLHYLTLSSLLWMCVGVNSMYKRLRKSDAIQIQDDELPSDEVIQKPILGLYLVGYGIGLIVCGISGAVNMKEYSPHTHCFLNSAPALSALYIPCSILFIVLAIFFMLIRCAIYSTDANGHLSEGTQATENVDLDLLEPNFPHLDSRSMRSISTKTTSSELEDMEHAPMAQLKAYIIFLFIYILAWFCLAIATVKPIKVIPFEEDIFSVAYAISSSLLGTFTFFFYCVARNDVRTQWMFTSRWLKRKSYLRSRNVSDASPNLPQIQIQPLPAIPPLPEVHNILSRSSSRSSAQTKSISHHSNVLKGAVDLNTSTSNEATGAKINNVNLVVLHRQQYRKNGGHVPNLIENPTHSAEMFYNPHQSTVARKFFKKQKKRHLLKHNNLTMPRRTDLNSENGSVILFPLNRGNSPNKPDVYTTKKDNSSVDTSKFSSNSKVNNKNIHIERVPKINRDLNILSDSCDDLSLSIPVEKLIMNAAKCRRKESKHKTKRNQPTTYDNMRSVSQQCTLEYSSEPLTDSNLDLKLQDSPVKQICNNVNVPNKLNSPQDTFAQDFNNISFNTMQDSFTNTDLSETMPSMRRENSPIENMSVLTEEPYINSDINFENISILTKEPQFYNTNSGNYMQKILNTGERKEYEGDGAKDDSYDPNKMSYDATKKAYSDAKQCDSTKMTYSDEFYDISKPTYDDNKMHDAAKISTKYDASKVMYDDFAKPYDASAYCDSKHIDTSKIAYSDLKQFDASKITHSQSCDTQITPQSKRPLRSLERRHTSDKKQKPSNLLYNTSNSQCDTSNSPYEAPKKLHDDKSSYNQYDSKLFYDLGSEIGADDSMSELTNDFNEPTVYINPSSSSRDLFVASRASSVSASEIEELYQQIKRGPKSKHSSSHRYVNECCERVASPCLSDSEVNAHAGTSGSRWKYKKRDKDETTV